MGMARWHARTASALGLGNSSPTLECVQDGCGRCRRQDILGMNWHLGFPWDSLTNSECILPNPRKVDCLRQASRRALAQGRMRRKLISQHWVHQDQALEDRNKSQCKQPYSRYRTLPLVTLMHLAGQLEKFARRQKCIFRDGRTTQPTLPQTWRSHHQYWDVKHLRSWSV